MNEVIEATDCSPIKALTAETKDWLARLGQTIVPGPHVISFGEGERKPDEQIVYCERDGTWWCGRYVGTIHFAGRTLRIRPRLGMAQLERWLELALNLIFTEFTGEARDHDAVLPELLARLWSRGLVAAGRHGLPALRGDLRHHGHIVRGQLNMRQTLQERLAGRPGVSSVQRVRSLENPVVQAVVAGYTCLERWLGGARLTKTIAKRAQDLIDQMLAAVPRTGPPAKAELERVRYTPITAAFRPVVHLSMQIARRRGLFQDGAAEGTSVGMLLDIAELWELYVLACLRAAFPRGEVLHGTREAAANDWLLVSTQSGSPLGRLKPDALLHLSGRRIVVDAKYKSLRSTRYRPSGVEREDLYQMAAYLSRFTGEGGAGLLIYPADTSQAPPDVVANGPWSLGANQIMRFVALPVVTSDAVEALRVAVQ